MGDEIEEILDWLKDEDIYIEDYGYQYKRISLKETKQLLDYITNLQRAIKDTKDTADDMLYELKQENERLKEWNKDLLNENIELENIRKEAIEYYKYQLENLDFYEDTKARMLCAMGIALLQNGSDSQ